MTKRIAEIFWDNIETFVKEVELSKTRVQQDLNLNTFYFTTSKKRNAIPSAKIIERMAEYFDKEYIEFFEDWR